MTSIFANKKSDLFTTYRTTIQFRDRILGGIPKDPKMIEGWLRTKTGIDDTEEVRQMMLRTLLELGAEVSPEMGYDELVSASEHLAGVKHTQGFKQDATGLYIEDRIVKAMVKESVAILFPGGIGGNKWGPTKKGPRNYLAETVFIDPPQIHFMRDGKPITQPDGVHLMITHITGPGGARSALSYHEYVQEPTATFDVMVTRDGVPHEAWPEVWLHAQENGLGASRSQSFGRFDVTEWERLS